MDDLARLLLLLIAGAFFVQLTRGTSRAWLRAKFLGEPMQTTGTIRPASSLRSSLATSTRVGPAIEYDAQGRKVVRGGR